MVQLLHRRIDRRPASGDAFGRPPDPSADLTDGAGPVRLPAGCQIIRYLDRRQHIGHRGLQ